MKAKILATHSFCFNPKDNGGEGLTKIIDNGDGLPEGLYFEQTLSLQSYSNSAQFNLCGAVLTPTLLRQMADELDGLIAKHS